MTDKQKIKEDEERIERELTGVYRIGRAHAKKYRTYNFHGWKPHLDNIIRLFHQKDLEWKKKFEEIVPRMNDIWEWDDECWSLVRKDLMKVIKELLDGSSIKGDKNSLQTKK